MTDLQRKIECLQESERELDFQAKRCHQLGVERGNGRMIELAQEYLLASKAIRKLRAHQQRRNGLITTGDSRGG